jgi:hypothetical protein
LREELLGKDIVVCKRGKIERKRMWGEKHHGEDQQTNKELKLQKIHKEHSLFFKSIIALQLFFCVCLSLEHTKGNQYSAGRICGRQITTNIPEEEKIQW